MTTRTGLLKLATTATVLLAIAFYANFRESTWLGQIVNWAQLPYLSSLTLPTLITHHLPSWLQGLFLGLMYWQLTKHPKLYAIGFAAVTASTIELMQGTPLLVGTFDWLDLLFAIMGAASIGLFKASTQPTLKPNQGTQTKRQSSTLPTTGLAIGSFVLAMGCIMECDPESDTCVYPVTMTWEELRADIEPSYGNETQLTRAGKVHVKGDHLFVIDEFRGVHIFDQTDPLNPTRLVFIPIIGALDLSFNGDYLYINSFTDLLSIEYQTILDGSFTQAQAVRHKNVFGVPSVNTFLPEGYEIEGEFEKYSDYRANSYYYPRKYPEKGLIIGYYDINMEPVIFADFKMEGVK